MTDASALCCPHCRSALEVATSELACRGCQRRFPVIAGIPDLRVFPDPFIDLEADRAKARHLAERSADFDFPGLVRHYYATTSVVPPRDAERFTRSLMGAVARADAALEAWAHAAPAPADGTLLDLGCGTAPLLVASRGRFQRRIGVDIALRWLIVAKKRLAEAGVDATLVCACAEALPLPDATVGVVAAESALEMLRDQEAAMREAHRVLRPHGRLWLTTPNRWSVGPDPHVGTWAAGYLPERLVFRRVLREGGIAPVRSLLSLRSLRSLLRRAGFAEPHAFPPDVPEGQRRTMRAPVRAAVGLYRLVRSLAPGRKLLLLIGPMIAAVATRRDESRERG